jgi:hypothetical protein
MGCFRMCCYPSIRIERLKKIAKVLGEDSGMHHLMYIFFRLMFFLSCHLFAMKWL